VKRGTSDNHGRGSRVGRSDCSCLPCLRGVPDRKKAVIHGRSDQALVVASRIINI